MYIYFNYHSLVSTSLPSKENVHPHNISSAPSSQSNEQGSILITRGNISTDFDEIPASEVLVPVVMFVILSVIQSNIAASHSLDERNRRNHPGNRARSRSQAKDEAVDVQSRVRSSSIRIVQTPPQSLKKNSISGQSVQKRRKRRSPDNKIKEVRIQDALNIEGPQVVPVAEKKPSDEESGLEISESFAEQPLQSFKRRSFKRKSEVVKKTDIKPVAEVPSNEEESSTPIQNSGRSSPAKTNEGSSPEVETTLATGDEGDHEGDDDEARVDDMSSQDEMSPYSTVNSVENSHWYGELVSQRLRTMSQSSVRRYSNSMNEPARRPRANTIIRNCSSHKVITSGPGFSKIPVTTNSSCDSEGSMSPTTPNKGVATDMDWPMINSEGTSEDEDDEDVIPTETSSHQPTLQSVSTGVISDKRPPAFGETDSSLFTGSISAPPFYYPDDPDSLPPTIFSFCDDWMLGSRNCDKKNNDKGNDLFQF